MSLPLADDVLSLLGFHQQLGPAEEVEIDAQGRETGWIRGPQPWRDLRRNWSHPDRRSLVDQVRTTNERLPQAERISLAGKTYRRVCFADREGNKAPADLAQARFAADRTISFFKDVVFVNSRLIDVYFRGCVFLRCDFRYAYVLRTSFQDCKFYDCDFYRAHFAASNVFTKAEFYRVSLDKAWLAGVTGLRYAQLADGGLAQESGADEYAKFLQATRGQAPASDARERAVADAEIEVADVYRGLSGMWTAQGQLADAGDAYVRCKTLERRYYNPKRRRERVRDRKKRGEENPQEDKRWARQTWRWLGLWAARLLAKYGEGMWLVVLWLAALIILPAVVFSIFGGIQWEKCSDELKPCDDEVRSLPSTLLYSLERLTDSVSNMHTINSGAALVGAVQVFLGIALLGLLGFTIANRLRNT